MFCSNQSNSGLQLEGASSAEQSFQQEPSRNGWASVSHNTGLNSIQLPTTGSNVQIPKSYGFFCHLTNTFYFCQSLQEFTLMQAELAVEPADSPQHMETEDPWEPLFEIFNDERLSRSQPDPTLQLISQ